MYIEEYGAQEMQPSCGVSVHHDERREETRRVQKVQPRGTSDFFRSVAFERATEPFPPRAAIRKRKGGKGGSTRNRRERGERGGSLMRSADAHLEELVDEELDALDSGVVAAIDLGRLPRGLLHEQADERVAPVAELHRVPLALAGIVVGGLYGLIVRHILDHPTGAGNSGGLPHRLLFPYIFFSLSLYLFHPHTHTHTTRTGTLLFSLSLSLSSVISDRNEHSITRATRADTPETMRRSSEPSRICHSRRTTTAPPVAITALRRCCTRLTPARSAAAQRSRGESNIIIIQGSNNLKAKRR